LKERSKKFEIIFLVVFYFLGKSPYTPTQQGALQCLSSKMLGHADVKTTQVYAQIVDEKKQKAANAIKLNINNIQNSKKQ